MSNYVTSFEISILYGDFLSYFVADPSQWIMMVALVTCLWKARKKLVQIART
jgi:hypothetical protein